MSELVDRAVEVAGDTAGGVVNASVAALLTAAGVALNKPELAVAAVPGGALADALTAQGVAYVRRTWQDRSNRVAHFIETAEQAAGEPIEDLIDAAAKDERLRELLARSVEGASGSYDPWKVETLAKAFVRGAKDGAAIDEMLILIDLVRPLEVPHIRVLAVLYLRRSGGRDVAVQAAEFHQADRALGAVVTVLAIKLKAEGL